MGRASAAQRLSECVAERFVPSGPAFGANHFGSRCEAEHNATDLLLIAAESFPLPTRVVFCCCFFLNLFVMSAAAATVVG